ncbi:MAG: imidazoleglycerol-phosphate dehydratase HisB [Blastocatellia bacterium]|nr:imidazoleglycerol-phosphate dehydratase HisB [Blastocatellia bacterium]
MIDVTVARLAHIVRTTRETRVEVELNLDGQGTATISTGIPFFDHMLHQLARHGRFDLCLTCVGDLEIDGHHTVEDVGITLGQAFAKALGDKVGLVRYGHAYVPMDEALARAVVDFSGRPFVVYQVTNQRERIGTFEVELAEHFWHSFAQHAACTLHLEVLYGKNQHHILEATFKAAARALEEAVRRDPRITDVPSTKGLL